MWKGNQDSTKHKLFSSVNIPLAQATAENYKVFINTALEEGVYK